MLVQQMMAGKTSGLRDLRDPRFTKQLDQLVKSGFSDQQLLDGLGKAGGSKHAGGSRRLKSQGSDQGESLMQTLEQSLHPAANAGKDRGKGKSGNDLLPGEDIMGGLQSPLGLLHRYHRSGLAGVMLIDFKHPGANVNPVAAGQLQNLPPDVLAGLESTTGSSALNSPEFRRLLNLDQPGLLPGIGMGNGSGAPGTSNAAGKNPLKPSIPSWVPGNKTSQTPAQKSNGQQKSH